MITRSSANVLAIDSSLSGSLLCTSFLALARKLHEQPEPLLESMASTLALERVIIGREGTHAVAQCL